MRFPEIGEIFAHNYRIEKLLGSGGFSRVYQATQLDLERAVAIKILQPPLQGIHDDQERDERLQGLISRFEREARMVSKLRSPHTITMYAYGQADDGQLFMSIEYVDGLTLSDLVRAQGALSADRVAKIMRQVLLGLYEAHELGMLHRDIKPQNIMVYEHLGQKDQVKLLDFGIVKLISSESTRDQVDLTSDDTLVGTPRYMAPEYIRGEDLTPSSDLYSLGLVMYELLVGERAIQADSSIQIIGKQLERESFYLPAQLPTTDIALRSIINGMLEKNTKKRYQNAAAILEDLAARERNQFVAPPNAPRLHHTPTHKVDLTDRLTEAITERRSPEPLIDERQEPSIPAVPMPREVSFAPPAAPEPQASAPDNTKKLLVAAVLFMGLIFVVGTAFILLMPGQTPDSPPPLASTKQLDTISADTPTTPKENSEPLEDTTAQVDKKDSSTPSEVAAQDVPDDTTEPAAVPDKEDVEPAEPKEDTKQPAQKTSKSTKATKTNKTTKTSDKTRKKTTTTEPDTSQKINLLPKNTGVKKEAETKKTEPKTEPKNDTYKLIIPE